MKNSNKRIIAIVSILLCLGVLIWTVKELFAARFSQGDIYPEYSSLRTDPFGCKALFESLNEMEFVTVERIFGRLEDDIAEPKNSVLWCVGVKQSSYTQDKDLKEFVLSGGKAVIIFSPKVGEHYFAGRRMKKCQSGKCKPEGEKTESEEQDEKPVLLKKSGAYSSQLWRVGVKQHEKGNQTLRQAEVHAENLPAGISFREFPVYSGKHLELPKEQSWKVLYSAIGEPVMAARKMGGGTLVVSSASFVFSNEGLHKSCNPELISYLIGKRQNIYFNERLHGVIESRNIIWLCKKYNLLIVAVNLILVLLFFIWRNMMTIDNFSLKHDEKHVPATDIDVTFSASSGLANVLSRTLPVSSITAESLQEWLKTSDFRHIDEKKRVRIQELMQEQNETKMNQVVYYNRICDILTEKPTFMKKEKRDE